MKENIIGRIIDYFRNNEDIFNECIEKLDSWDGFLGDDRYYEMEELNELYHGTDPIYLLERAFYGHDEETGEFDDVGGEIIFDFYRKAVREAIKDTLAFFELD